MTNEITPERRAELRKTAEAALKDWGAHLPTMALREFHRASRPLAVLALLDALDAKDAELERLREQIGDPADSEPCDAEKHSWGYFTPEVVDSYWMRCHKLGPHDEHENSETGATWND